MSVWYEDAQTFVVVTVITFSFIVLVMLIVRFANKRRF